MAYVINDKCQNEQYAQCVEVCPVDCIYPGELDRKPYMVIDPQVCIDCGACLPICRIGAILEKESEDPEATKLNSELAPKFKHNDPVIPRAANAPPNRKDNKLQ